MGIAAESTGAVAFIDVPLLHAVTKAVPHLPSGTRTKS